MTYQRNKNRIAYLKREYNETHLNSQELVSSQYKSETNKKYYDREQIKMVDDVLYTLPAFTANLLKEEVYYIFKHYRLKDISAGYKIEVVLASIILFVWKSYNRRLVINDNKIWRTYELSWECYAKIITKLLIKTRENCPTK